MSHFFDVSRVRAQKVGASLYDGRVTLALGHHVVVGHCQQRRCRLRQRLYAAERGMRQRGARECRYLHSTTPSAARGGRCLLCQQPGAALIARACIRTPDRRRRTQLRSRALTVHHRAVCLVSRRWPAAAIKGAWRGSLRGEERRFCARL